ncbi:RNA polymerase sigma factor [Nitrospira sp.]|nr:RNA polymerase sigma factor [Nitrospira sp.]
MAKEVRTLSPQNSTHPTSPDELDLIRRIAGGDTRAFEVFYRLYERRLYHYIRTLVQNEATLEELVTDVMLAVWNSAASFRSSSRPSTWIFGIARHKALDAVRRLSRPIEHTIPIDEAADLPDRAGGPADAAQSLRLGTLTRTALARLSVEHQEALRMVFFEELSYEEIAELTHVPINTVKTRVFYAKQHLKRELERMQLQAELP